MPPPPAPGATVATPITSRPLIKLKVGTVHGKPADSMTASPVLTPSKLPKQRKPKPVERRSLQDVDDGTADLFAEVDAIESEKHGAPQRHRPTPPVKLAFKRKRTPTGGRNDDIDDFLALATPSKKERPSPPEVGAQTSNESLAPKPKLVMNLSARTKKPEKSASPAPSGHPPASVPVPTAPPAASVATPVAPRITLKGKERDTASSSPAPAQAIPKAKQSMFERLPINEKKCKDVIKLLLKLPEAGIFSRPVDPIADGCPTWVFYLLVMKFGWLTIGG